MSHPDQGGSSKAETSETGKGKEDQEVQRTLHRQNLGSLHFPGSSDLGSLLIYRPDQDDEKEEEVKDMKAEQEAKDRKEEEEEAVKDQVLLVTDVVYPTVEDRTCCKDLHGNT